MLTRSMTKRPSEAHHYGPQAGTTKKLQNASSGATPNSGLCLAAATYSPFSESFNSDSATSGPCSVVEESSATTTSVRKSPACATSTDKSSAPATSVEKVSSVSSANGAPPATTDSPELERTSVLSRSYVEMWDTSFDELMAMGREKLKESIRAMGGTVSDSDEDHEPYDGSDYTPDVDYELGIGEFAPKRMGSEVSSVSSANGHPPGTTDSPELRTSVLSRSYVERWHTPFDELMAMGREKLKESIRAMGGTVSDSDENHEPYDGSDYTPDVDYELGIGEFAPKGMGSEVSDDSVWSDL